jgi:hypothetical protein
VTLAENFGLGMFDEGFEKLIENKLKEVGNYKDLNKK